MALTSNETAWANTIVQLIVSLAWGTLLAWVAIKVKKPEDIKYVIAKIRNIIVRFLCWATILFSLFLFVGEFISSDPISKGSIFRISFALFAIIVSLVARFIISLIELLMDYFNFQHEQLVQSNKFKTAIKEIMGSLPCFGEVSEKIIKAKEIK